MRLVEAQRYAANEWPTSQHCDTLRRCFQSAWLERKLFADQLDLAGFARLLEQSCLLTIAADHMADLLQPNTSEDEQLDGQEERPEKPLEMETGDGNLPEERVPSMNAHLLEQGLYDDLVASLVTSPTKEATAPSDVCDGTEYPTGAPAPGPPQIQEISAVVVTHTSRAHPIAGTIAT